MLDKVSAYPLHWTPSWPCTSRPQRSAFGKHSYHKATQYLLKQLELLGAKQVVVSTNLQLRLDGLPYSTQPVPADCGVAVYFHLENTPQCFPCDKWDKTEHNLYAIAKTIEALRGIQRWGSREMVAASFRGFNALPETIEETQSESIQWFADCTTISDAKRLFRSLANQFHPDKPSGNPAAFIELKQHYDQFVLNSS